MYVHTHICTEGRTFVHTYPRKEKRKTVCPRHHPTGIKYNLHIFVIFLYNLHIFVWLQHSLKYRKTDQVWSFFYIIWSFFYIIINLDIFIWIQHGSLPNTVFTLDPSNRVIKRLWCTYTVVSS